MSNPVPEFEIDTQIERCDATMGEDDTDEEGRQVLTPIGKCGGQINWKTEQLDDSHWASFGTCPDCGALYTTKG
ncbi:MAG: hypothetical protein QQN63_13390 [Nitrosopumilus sp.]